MFLVTTILSALLLHTAIALPDGCCPFKTVGGISYSLAGDSGSTPADPSCTSNCIYKPEGQPGVQVCFKPGNLESTCNAGDGESCPVDIKEQQAEAIKEMDFEAVKQDLRDLMTNSKDFWPADYENYGPFMIRLAWHSAGSYRESDGRGGGNGGRIRFEPEQSWPDNTNLDKARKLLWPLKQKYGLGLSWGDLMILAGNIAIEVMGGPVKGFCGGRIDDEDGSLSSLLGPNQEQMVLFPCPVQGKCEAPLGPTTVGLIYVNPEGQLGQPIPEKSAEDIRSSFGRMGMNDEETVALIGGGHAFGKSHGPCPFGPGKPPKDEPLDPWKGNCSSGKGMDTFTSGFELTWTSNPVKWDNEYFQNLVNYTWDKYEGPGGHFQWQVTPGPGPSTPTAHGSDETYIGMLTSDVALVKDPIYKEIVELFASNKTAIDVAFSDVWYKLTTRDMGPVERCLGSDVPPAQPWQYPLPPAPAALADFSAVKQDLLDILGTPSASGALARLAWQCSSTFRRTDYLGGCNGARIRLSPQKDWPINVNLDTVLASLTTIKEQYQDSLSWADLIILAGNTALEELGGQSLVFCGGRTDAMEDGGYSAHLETKVPGNMTLLELNNFITMKGLTVREFAVLNGAGYAVGDVGCEGFFCQRDGGSTMQLLSNVFFKTLLSEKWQLLDDSTPNKVLYVAQGAADLVMQREDLYFITEPEWKVISEEYATDNDKFLADFAKVWTKVSNADRYDGPTGSVC